MSRSYRKVCKRPICCVSENGIRKWKHLSTKHRRAVEKAQMNGIYEDEDGFDEESCFSIKYQKDRTTNDWSGPHDGWTVTGPKALERDIEDWKTHNDHDIWVPDEKFIKNLEKCRWHYFDK